MTTMEARRFELYADLEDCVTHSLRRAGIDEAPAAAAAAGVVDTVISLWGGQNLTFPKDGLAQARIRQAYIVEHIKQVSVPDLARELGISERAVRKAHKRGIVSQKLRFEGSR